MMFKIQCLLVALVVGHVWSAPSLYHDPVMRLAAVSELGTRLAARAQHDPEARLPLPTPQDLEAIKKVAQVLIMLGQQVIPAIIGEPSSSSNSNCDTEDVPNDAVSNS